MVGWVVHGYSVDWLIGLLVGWSVGGLVDMFDGSLVGCLFVGLFNG